MVYPNLGETRRSKIKQQTDFKKDYRIAVDQFQRQLCSPGTEEKFWDLYKNFKGDGFYLPIRMNKFVNKKAISVNLGLVAQKITWLKSIQSRLKNMGKLPDGLELLSQMQEQIDRNLYLKYLYEVKKQPDSIIDYNVKGNVKKLKKLFKKIEQDFFYLFNFNYPNNHLANRARHARYSQAKKMEIARRKDALFVKRKILEDGALPKNSKSNDKFLRTALDHIKLRMIKVDRFITDDLRVDLEWVFLKMRKNIRRGYQYQVDKISNWLKREQKRLKFYKSIIQADQKELAALVSKKNNATQKLKEFVYSRQAEVYRFWTKQSLELRKIFVIENILYNEVGYLDALGVERQEILEIIHRRTKTPPYERLTKFQMISDKLSGIDTNQFKWLNTYFRRGEFSFTLYYISSVVRVFCPNNSKRGWKLRNENIQMAIDFIKTNNPVLTSAVRYFSRVSMIGKIDMSIVWNGFTPLEERPGPLLERSKAIFNQWKKGQFRYLYSFSFNQKIYRVYEVFGKAYVFDQSAKPVKIYFYRNPHLFKYFKDTD